MEDKVNWGLGSFYMAEGIMENLRFCDDFQESNNQEVLCDFEAVFADCCADRDSIIDSSKCGFLMALIWDFS